VPSGSVRATFEDKILASDTIFLRSWFAVSIPKFYTPITNLLTNTHVNVKPLSILKKEKELQIVPNVNSLYKPIEREERVSKPFKVNRHIEEQLPFQFKTKSEANKLNLIDKQRVAIIKEPREAKVIFFLFALN
jgi:ribosome biogenesis protein BMS1